MKYRVTYEYRGTVTLDINATDEPAAEQAGLEIADEMIQHVLHVYSVRVKPARKEEPVRR